jgi:hypothetical protein
VTFEHWLSLSDPERCADQQHWNAYGEGYWHALLAEAAKRFELEFASVSHVCDIHHGTYHGGDLIIGVTTDLSYPQTITLPESFLGFRVMQFCGATPEPIPRSDANHLTNR